MKFQYLGTAAAEGIPAFVCNCKACVRSRELGGRALRTRSQAIIDDSLLIDFPADTMAHIHANKIDLIKVKDCIVTHSHYDHLHPVDLNNFKPGFAYFPEGWHMTFHGSDKVGEAVAPQLEGKLTELNIVSFEELKAFEPKKIGRYTVTPLLAIHDPKSGPLFYQISDGEKTILYANDTNYFDESVWEYWEKTKPSFDMVSLDCTNACKPMTYIGHMSFAENLKVRDRMIEMGIADDNTKFISHHFSHNGTNVVYDDFVAIAAKEGFLVSYDGMILEI
jgi:phosphoribosyl 1,2-cyclic phosphate phosphodiesterase